MPLVISSLLEKEMLEHLEKCYPEEGCGFFLGQAKEDKVVVRLFQATNMKDDTRERRYLIDPDAFAKADEEARSEGLDIVGIYHSHPDHPSRPSDFDREHAWPWYSYVVVAVEKGRAKKVTSWVLQDDRTEFLEETIRKEP